MPLSGEPPSDQIIGSRWVSRAGTGIRPVLLNPDTFSPETETPSNALSQTHGVRAALRGRPASAHPDTVFPETETTLFVAGVHPHGTFGFG